MEQFTTLLANQAFPIVLSIYLLTRLESKIESLNRAINELGEALQRNAGN